MCCDLSLAEMSKWTLERGLRGLVRVDVIVMVCGF